jgi:hypothetical protein
MKAEYRTRKSTQWMMLYGKRYRFKDKVQYLGYTPVSLGKEE